jgi:hypothetical protein
MRNPISCENWSETMKPARFILLSVALLSALASLIAARVLYTGWGLLDFWIIYPHDVYDYPWWIPLLLFHFAILLFLAFHLTRPRRPPTPGFPIEPHRKPDRP